MAETEELPPAGIAELLPALFMILGILIVLLYGLGCLGSSGAVDPEKTERRKKLVKAGSASTGKVRDPQFEEDEDDDEEEEDEDDEDDKVRCCPQCQVDGSETLLTHFVLLLRRTSNSDEWEGSSCVQRTRLAPGSAISERSLFSPLQVDGTAVHENISRNPPHANELKQELKT
eukprot:2408166-Rhodomonas_salina.4